jgi:hypothetical protein
MGTKKQSNSTDKTLTRKVTKSLACKLTEAEVLQYGRDMAQEHAEYNRIEGEMKSVQKEYKAKLEEKEANISKLSGRVHSGIEARDVACTETKNWTAGTVYTVRLDTMEVIEDRPMREDEKQMEIGGIPSVKEPESDKK